jgi:hypothetical protein
MNKPLDRNSIARAMKEAAWVAKHGTREERSGRFLPPQQAPVIAEPGKQPKLDNS